MSSKRIHQVLMFRSIHLYLGHIISWACYILGMLYLGHIIYWACHLHLGHTNYFFCIPMIILNQIYIILLGILIIFWHTHDNFKPDIYNSLGHTNYFFGIPMKGCFWVLPYQPGHTCYFFGIPMRCRVMYQQPNWVLANITHCIRVVVMETIIV